MVTDSDIKMAELVTPEAKKKDIEVLLAHIINRSEMMADSIADMNRKLDVLQKHQVVFFHIMKKAQEAADKFRESEKMLAVCHTAFTQVRDACQCLRDELATATGNIVTEPWEEDIV